MRRPRLLVLLLLIALFARLTFDAERLSFTSDEPSHIASGYAFLAEQATWTVALRGHPLLIDAWIALPVYLGTPGIPVTQLEGWEADNTRFVQAFVPYIRPNVERTELAARIPVMLLSVLLAAVIARWAMDIGGRTGSIAALIAMICDPTFLGHGMLATNDVGVTTLGALGLYLTIRFLRQKRPLRLLSAGMVLGLTALAKGSGLVWLLSALVMIGVDGLCCKPMWRGVRRSVGHAMILAAVALCCIWAFYGFSLAEMELLGRQLRVPAGTHWHGVLMQSGGAEERWTYFLGEVRRGGTWAYFPTAFLLKNPVPFLILASWGLVRTLTHSEQRHASIWVFPITYSVVAVASGVNIGYRHMIPIHPFIYLSIARIPWHGAVAKPIAGVLLAALAIETAFAAPYYLSHFNALVGGAEEGWRYLADSNTDWGQGYKALRTYQIDEGIDSVAFSGPEGYIGLRTYDVSYAPLPPIPSNPEPILKPWLQPAPGTYVISANSLSGLGSVAPDNYAWFRYHKPVAVIADVLHVYEVEEDHSSTWLAQCSTPVAPLDKETIETGFWNAPKRQFSFDCTQSWIYAEGTSGWYAAHNQLQQAKPTIRERLGLEPPSFPEAFTQRHFGQLAVIYRQWDYRETPPHIIYESATDACTTPEVSGFSIAPAGTPPHRIEVDARTTVRLTGPVNFVGAVGYSQNGSLEIETWWQRRSGDLAAPISIMAHLVTAEGTQISIADGLGVDVASLRKGDLFVQSHTFAESEAASDLWLRTGIYEIDSLELWNIEGSHSNAVFVPVAEITEL